MPSSVPNITIQSKMLMLYCYRVIVLLLTPGSGISMGKDIKQGDDDGMKNEYEGVHLAPAPEKSRGGFVILWVKVGVGRWHFSVFWCVSEAKIGLSGRIPHFLTVLNAGGEFWRKPGPPERSRNDKLLTRKQFPLQIIAFAACFCKPFCCDLLKTQNHS